MTAPRPATSSGNEAASSSAATVSTSEVAGAGRPIVALAGAPVISASRAGRSIGTLSTTGSRSVRARWRARAASADAVWGACTRSAIAPHSRAIAAWSILKFDHWTAEGVSAVSSSAGVRALAASTRPVRAFVNPGPWCVVHTAMRSDTRP